MAEEDVVRLDLPENPTLAVEVGGRVLHLELGNMTYALEIKRWVDDAQSTGDGAESDLDKLQRIAEDGLSIVSSAFVEPDAADALLGGRDRLNVSRIMSILKFISVQTTSASSMEVMQRAVEDFSATGDED
jgi:hypothetical protein